MLTGKRDRRLTISRPIVTQGAEGGKVTAWQTVVVIWAQKIDLKGQEFLEAGQTRAGAEVKFRILYRRDFDETCRFNCEGVDYDVIHIAEIGRREGLEILAKRP